LLSSVSSFSLAFVVIFDRLMVVDCYRNRPDQAWLVSSVTGAVLGLVATLISWVVVVLATEITFGSLVGAARTHWPSLGWLMVLSGAIAIQVARHYFRLFVPERDAGPVNETAIAMWLASTPIFIYAAVALIQIAGLNRGPLAGLEEANVSWQFGILVTVTVLAMLRFEMIGNDAEGGSGLHHHTQIAWLLVTTVVYTIILSAVLLPEERSLEAVVALLPLYWVGFAAGARILLVPAARQQFAENWRRMKRFLRPILVAEVFGMSVFFFEFFALGSADPTLVNLIVSAHVLLVFLMVVRLARLRASMEARGIRRIWFLGIRLTQRRLPEIHDGIRGQVQWLAVAFVGLASCIYVTT
jgi:hypothetical protein